MHQDCIYAYILIY